MNGSSLIWYEIRALDDVTVIVSASLLNEHVVSQAKIIAKGTWQKRNKLSTCLIKIHKIKIQNSGWNNKLYSTIDIDNNRNDLRIIITFQTCKAAEQYAYLLIKAQDACIVFVFLSLQSLQSRSLIAAIFHHCRCIGRLSLSCSQPWLIAREYLLMAALTSLIVEVDFAARCGFL